MELPNGARQKPMHFTEENASNNLSNKSNSKGIYSSIDAPSEPSPIRNSHVLINDVSNRELSYVNSSCINDFSVNLQYVF